MMKQAEHDERAKSLEENKYRCEEIKIRNFLKRSWSRPETEYMLLKNAVELGDLKLDRIKKQPKFSIFQTRDENVNDKKRRQVNLDNPELINKLGLKRIEENVTSIFQEICGGDNFKLGGSVLQSLPGCWQQEWHSDYGLENDEENEENIKNCYIAIVALMKETYFYGTTPENHEIKLEFEAGDVFVARGMYIHAGSDYQKENFRLHYYIDTNGYERNNDRTYYANEDAVYREKYKAFHEVRILNAGKGRESRAKKRRIDHMAEMRKVRNLGRRCLG